MFRPIANTLAASASVFAWKLFIFSSKYIISGSKYPNKCFESISTTHCKLLACSNLRDKVMRSVHRLKAEQGQRQMHGTPSRVSTKSSSCRSSYISTVSGDASTMHTPKALPPLHNRPVKFTLQSAAAAAGISREPSTGSEGSNTHYARRVAHPVAESGPSTACEDHLSALPRLSQWFCFHNEYQHF